MTERMSEPSAMYPVTAAITALGEHLSQWRRGKYGAFGGALADIDTALRELEQLRDRLVAEADTWADTGSGSGYEPPARLLCGAGLGDGRVCKEPAGHPGYEVVHQRDDTVNRK